MSGSMVKDVKELQKILENTSYDDYDEDIVHPNTAEKPPELPIERSFTQWSSLGNGAFSPVAETKRNLVPGVYEIAVSQDVGIYFKKVPHKTDGLVKFPQTNSETVISEICKFWEKEEVFAKHEIVYRRGIVLWGPPGSGKSCTIQLLIKDIIDRNGIVLNFGQPELFISGLRILRQVEPDVPVIVLMEDLESTIYYQGESVILNILDGVNELHKIVFLATTNYPEKLGARIINRPSRFDKRFKIGHPNEESREIFIKHLFKDDVSNIDLQLWIEDTDGFSLAHLKELFVATQILGDDYNDAIEVLGSMRERPSAEENEEFAEPERSLGFNIGSDKSNKSH